MYLNNLLTRQLDYVTIDLFSKIIGAFLFRIFGGFLHVPTAQIYCLTGAIIRETRMTNIYLDTIHDPPQCNTCSIRPNIFHPWSVHDDEIVEWNETCMFCSKICEI